ncbi:MAG: zinc metallopeptidase [Oscillospiraceae bacterium]|jgi:Zn-dependent membrane protease YugP|nr:zinc metallopeptidase [Oscillospiraceae bacterium]
MSFYIDQWYIILVLPTIVISFLAQFKVKSSYRKYSRIATAKGITGAMAARIILDSKGLYNVAVTQIGGEMTDHFNPKTNVVALSTGVYNSASVAAVGIAAHEVGHAIQHSEKYFPAQIRAAIVPTVNFSARISWFAIIVGLLFSIGWLAVVGLVLISFSTLFQLVTLPVELDASRRANNQLAACAVIAGKEEENGVRNMLTAAAMTYVAALLTSVATLLRLILIVNGRGRR